MIRHTVMFRFKESATPEEIASFSNGLSEMVPKIDVIVNYQHGSDLGANEGNFDYVVTADFADLDGYTTYRDHPEHKAVIARTSQVIEGRAAVQFEWQA